jgi:hypothetical protein
MVLISALTVLLGISLVYAVSYALKPKNSSQTLPASEVVGKQDGLELTMMLEKTEYSLGESININFSITNISNQTISFTFSGMIFDFHVYNDTNNSIYQWSVGPPYRAFPDYIAIIPLDAGESLTDVLVWPNTISSEGVPVSPGAYYIVGSNGYNYKFQTAPMQVTIVKP